MALTTALLTVGFVVCALLCGVFRKRSATTVLMAILCIGTFTVYALTGENEGFSILWMLLVPAISMSLIGLRAGTVLSGYFQIFLMLLFWTPLKEAAPGCYTATFQVRFPVLYLTSFAAAVILTVQKEYYFQKTEQMVYADSLTGLHNRRYYDIQKSRMTGSTVLSKLSIVSIDVNRLKYTNDTLGHRAGDELIFSSAYLIRNAFPDAETICRVGGDEFMILTFAPKEKLNAQITALRTDAAAYRGTYVQGVWLSIGCANGSDVPEPDIIQLEKAADAAMYDDKSNFYLTHGFERRR